jgi:hypothetical protein
MTEALMNLSTDMAVGVMKSFLKGMAQTYDGEKLGVSMWDEEMVQNVSTRGIQRLEDVQNKRLSRDSTGR